MTRRLAAALALSLALPVAATAQQTRAKAATTCPISTKTASPSCTACIGKGVRIKILGS